MGDMTTRELCERKGMKRPVDLAKRTGLSRQHAHLLWTGRLLFSREMAKKLAPILGETIETLIMLEHPAQEKNSDEPS